MHWHPLPPPANGLKPCCSTSRRSGNSRDRNLTLGKIDRRQEQVEQSIQRYLEALETADRTQPTEVEAKTARLQEKISKLREQMRQLDDMRDRLKSLPDCQLSRTDPDARSMATSAQGSGMVGYNVQSAVDAEHHLIVAHEVNNIGNDRAQLARMAKAASQQLQTSDLQAFADRGYFSGPELKACEDAGITTFVPKPLTSSAKAEGRFDKADFIYIAQDNEYQCPAGERATHRFRTVEKGQTLDVYWSSACPGCSMRHQCTTGDFANHVHGDHLFALLTCSARQWSTLVNFELADPTLHDPSSVGVNTCCPTLLSDPARKNLFLASSLPIKCMPMSGFIDKKQD